MKKDYTINYFNRISASLFQKLADIRYTIRLLEINEEKNFIGLSFVTDNFSVNITVLTPHNFNYFHGQNCSVVIFDINDVKMKNELFKIVSNSLTSCINMVLEEDFLQSINNPIFCEN